MNWRLLAVVKLTLGLFHGARGYGTTISVALSYCPATTSISGGPNPYPTNGILQHFFLYLSGSSSTGSQYLTGDGGLTTELGQAIPFFITPNGQLMSGNDYFSASQGVANQEFVASNFKFDISTSFFISQDHTLHWENDQFAGRSAIFCSNGSVLTVVFDGQLPEGCSLVSLAVIPSKSNLTSDQLSSTTFLPEYSSTSAQSTVRTTSSVPTSSTMPSTQSAVYGNIAAGTFLGCLTSPSGEQPIIGLQEKVSSLEECVDFCRNNKYFGLKFGDECSCGNYISPDSNTAPLGSCNTPCSGNNLVSCGGQDAMVIYSIVPTTGASNPTSTATTTTTPRPMATSTASSIVSGSPYPAPTTTGSPNCFDRSPFDGTVNAGYLILCDTDLPGFTLEAVEATDIADCIDACNSYEPSSQGECIAVQFDILSEAQPCQLKFGITTVNRGDNAFAQAAIVVNQPYSPQILFSDSGTSSMSSGTALSSSTSTTISMRSLTSLSTTTNSNFVPTSSSATTMTTRLSASNLGSTNSPITYSSTTSSSLSTSPSSSASGLSSMTSSSLASSQTTSVSSSSSPGLMSSSGMASTNMLSTSKSTSTPSASSPVTSSTTILTTTTIATTSTTTSSAGFCLSSPTTTALCSQYNHQALIVNGDGICYEIECGTTLQGTVLNGNSSTAASLKVCLGFCTLFNIALPFGCVGVNFLGTNLSPNCILFSSINATVYTPGVDGGRLIYAGYPSIIDPLFGVGTTTPSVSSSATSSSSLTSTLSTTTTTTLTSSSLTPSGIATSSGGAVTSPTTAFPTTSTTGVTTRTSTSSASSITSSSATAVPTTTLSTMMSSSTSRTSSSSSTTITITTTTVSTPTTTTSSSSITNTLSTMSGMTTTTTTVSYSSTSCAPAPTDNSECPDTSPTCYAYNYYSPANYEIECMTVFTGAQLQPILTFALSDCIQYCQYANALTVNSCIGVSFNEGQVSQGGSNNCFRYSTLTCASRGNATYDSARLLYAGYPQMTDYSNSSFIC